MKVSASQVIQLSAIATQACHNAHCPYGMTPAGAAVLGESGKVYAGCEVENATIGLSMCAERVAIFRAITAGEKELHALAIYSPTDKPRTPCGACLEVLRELGGNARIISFTDADDYLVSNVQACLPSQRPETV